VPETLFPGVETHFSGREYAILDAGAQPIAWEPAGQLPVLWLSPLTDFDPGTAVRGGVPIVFPWFGNGRDGDRTPKHGFARTAVWRRTEVTETVKETGELTVRYTLEPPDVSDEHDTPDFEAELTASFGNTALTVSLKVTNTGAEPFTYEEALHTYIRVCDVTRIAVSGLEGCSYTDTATGAEPVRQLQTEPVRFEGEVDRIYDCAGAVVVDDPGFARRVRITAHGAANTVVWNPGRKLGTSIADVGQYWSEFVCVEAANVRASAVRLSAGEQHTLSQHVGLL
jgi:glucose-6-phosphate 1-epimerase